MKDFKIGLATGGKYLAALVFALSFNFQFLFAQVFRIEKVEYEISGQTQEKFLRNEVLIDTKKVFSSKEDLDSYISDCKTRLLNLRIFSDVNIEVSENLPQPLQLDYLTSTFGKNGTSNNSASNNGMLSAITASDFVPDSNSADSIDSAEIIPICLKIRAEDSKHFLLLPYPKYSSNDGAVLKLKMRDDNFRGTITRFEGEVFGGISDFSSLTPENFNAGFALNFNYPIFYKSFWIFANTDSSVKFTFDSPLPSYDINAGLSFVFPLEKNNLRQLVLDFSQVFVRGDEEHALFGNDLFYSEYAKISLPIKMDFADSTLAPYTDFFYCWSDRELNFDDSEISSPLAKAGLSFDFGRVDWLGNFRQGITADFDGGLGFDFIKNDIVPYFSAQVKAFKAWEKFGIASQLNFFQDENTRPIGTFLRGIRDTPEISSKNLADRFLYVPAALCLNLDFPFHLFSVRPKETSRIKDFGFEVQLAPFVDLALTKNSMTERFFSPKDGWYSGGFEVLVYPEKWKSIVVRASLGLDFGNLIFSKIPGSTYDTSWRSNLSAYEIFIGIGWQY
ncbi:MAG: hypothetical protein SOT81_06800 [Treponema sp.]|nr:hypothetical protein [Treponema sp.]